MMNPFVMRKFGALMLVGCICVVSFFAGMMYFGIWWAIGFFLVALLISTFLGSAMLANPYSKMLEGKGLMVWNMDSTGIISPFNVRLKSPWILGILNKKNMSDVWDREAVMQLDNYRDAEAFQKDNFIYMRIDLNAVNRDRFVHYTRPVMIYNEQLQNFITKDYFNKKETSAFAKHHLLFLLRLIEDLNVNVRDFARYIIEALKPKDKAAIMKWVAYIVIGIIIIVVIFVAIKYGPGILESLTGTGQAAQQAVGTAGNAMPSIKMG